jgi:hypothetical protein
MNFPGVEHERDLAFEHQAEVERLRLLHIGMRPLARTGRGRGRTHGAEIGFDLGGADLAAEHVVRRKGHDAAHRLHVVLHDR